MQINKNSNQLFYKLFKRIYHFLFILSLVCFYSAATEEERNKETAQQAPATACDSTYTAENIIRECLEETTDTNDEDENTQVKSCSSLVDKAVTCCQTPLNGCMDSSQIESALGAGHESLGMLNQLLPALSPGIANYAAESGIADICQMLAALTGAASSLSAAAKSNCSSAMSDCYNGCENKRLKQCKKIREEYNNWYPNQGTGNSCPDNKLPHDCSSSAANNCNFCKELKTQCGDPPSQVCLEEFKEKVQTQIDEISRLKNQQCKCRSQASQLAHMEQNIAESASSLQSASDCMTGISDGKLARTQAECLMKGKAFQWRGVGRFGQCISLAAECAKAGGAWAPIRNICQTTREACIRAGKTWDPRRGAGKECDLLSTTKTKSNLNTDDCPIGKTKVNGECVDSSVAKNCEKLGGKIVNGICMKEATGGGGSDTNLRKKAQSSSIALPGRALSGTPTAASSSTNPSALTGSAGSGFRIRSLKLPDPAEEEEEDEDELTHSGGGGGGGFRGYIRGGGGRGYGSNRSSRKLAGKLKNTKRKPIIKRTSNLAGQSQHHSIFERITKRFHQLCTYKINCN